MIIDLGDPKLACETCYPKIDGHSYRNHLANLDPKQLLFSTPKQAYSIRRKASSENGNPQAPIPITSKYPLISSAPLDPTVPVPILAAH